MTLGGDDGPATGVSACLYGCPVRYDGESFDAVAVAGPSVAGRVFLPVCPECMAGLGVPRERIVLTGTGDEVLDGEARVVDVRGRDVTEQVVAGARECLEALRRGGAKTVVLKERSPSCGPRSAPIERADGSVSQGAGVFAALCVREGLTVLDETALAGSGAGLGAPGVHRQEDA